MVPIDAEAASADHAVEAGRGGSMACSFSEAWIPSTQGELVPGEDGPKLAIHEIKPIHRVVEHQVVLALHEINVPTSVGEY